MKIGKRSSRTSFVFGSTRIEITRVTRWDMLGAGDQGQEVVTSSKVIEKMERSPQGIWYASQVRITSRNPSGEESVQLVRIYVDFDADLPDLLFEPPKVGRRY